MNQCIHCKENIEAGNIHSVIFFNGHFCNNQCVEKFISSKKDMLENWMEPEIIARQAHLGDRLTEEELIKVGFVIIDIIFGKLGTTVQLEILYALVKEILETLGIDSKKVVKFAEKYR